MRFRDGVQFLRRLHAISINRPTFFGFMYSLCTKILANEQRILLSEPLIFASYDVMNDLVKRWNNVKGAPIYRHRATSHSVDR